MSEFHLFQFHLSSRALAVLTNSDWGSDDPEIKAYKEAVLDGKPDLALAGGYYRHVSDIQAETIDGAFDYGNAGPESRITRHDKMRSPSAGDIFLSDQCEGFFCQSVGWRALSSEESAALWSARVNSQSDTSSSPQG